MLGTHCEHDMVLVALSYLVSDLGSVTALQMAVAVCGMHYTAMGAAHFVPHEGTALEVPAFSFGGEQLGLLIFALTTVLLGILFTTSWARQRQRETLSI